MRFLILNVDYREFLDGLYAQNCGLAEKSYQEQLNKRNESFFAIGDAYASGLRKLGHDAFDIHVNNETLQKAWAKEHNFHWNARPQWSFRLRRGFLPWLSRTADQWLLGILLAQIEHYRPDILWNQAMEFIPVDFLRRAKPMVRFVLGQHAATRLSNQTDWSVYDLVVSSFPPTIEQLRSRNVPAELHRLGFDPRVLTRLPPRERDIPVSFVGSFTDVHSSRTAFLATVARDVPLRVWGPPPIKDFGTAALAECYAGPAWGRQMFEILQRSRITLNHHGDVPPFANNMRLFEATGLGALLVTDWKANLHEMFKPDEEVVTYRTPEECIEKIRYYLDHEAERMALASAGQERTLQAHTYDQRMKELEAIIQRYL